MVVGRVPTGSRFFFSHYTRLQEVPDFCDIFPRLHVSFSLVGLHCVPIFRGFVSLSHRSCSSPHSSIGAPDAKRYQMMADDQESPSSRSRPLSPSSSSPLHFHFFSALSSFLSHRTYGMHHLYPCLNIRPLSLHSSHSLPLSHCLVHEPDLLNIFPWSLSLLSVSVSETSILHFTYELGSSTSICLPSGFTVSSSSFVCSLYFLSSPFRT